MERLLPLVLRSWALPFVVLALIAPAVAAFAFVGPQLGLAVGALTVAAVLALAARARYDEEIEVAASPDDRYRLLVVATQPLGDPALVDEIVAVAARGGAGATGTPAEVRVVVPARSSRLDRWASDLDAARDAAQRALAVSLGALAAAGFEVSGRVGDGDPVQAVEDELRGFAAREVALVREPAIGEDAVGEIRRRLDRPVIELGRDAPIRAPRPA